MTAAACRGGVALAASAMGLLLVMVCATTAAQSLRPADLYVPAGTCNTACCQRLWNRSVCVSDSTEIEAITNGLPRTRPRDTTPKEHT